MKGTLSVLAAATAFALAAPALADASVYCVGTSGSDCTFGYAGTGDGLQTAIDAADVNADIGGTPDTVRIGSGTYLRTNGDGFHTIGGDLMVEGAGPSTVLTTDANNNRTVLKVQQTTGGATAASVRNLQVDLQGLTNGIRDFLVVSDVRLSGPGSAIDGIHLPTGGRLTRTVIDPARIYADAVAMSSGVVEDVVVRLRRAGGAIARGVSVANDAAPTTAATVRHVTIAGDGATGTEGVLVQAVGDTGGPRTGTLSLRDSVLRGVDVPLDRFALAGGSNAGTANIDYRYSSLDLTPGKSSATGPGSFSAGPGNLDNPDPLFAPDLSLLAGSPLIDSGDPASPETGDSPTDAAGNPRLIGARRDIGAFEFRPTTGSAGGGGGGGGSAGPEPAVVTASRLGISPSSFPAAGGGPSATAATVRKKPRTFGGTVRYTLSIPASVRFTVRQSLPGRRQGKGTKARCVAQTRKNAKARRCTRVVTVRGSFTQSGKAGANRFRFSGRLRGHKLKPGRYTLVATPSSGGRAGRSVSTSFRIVK